MMQTIESIETFEGMTTVNLQCGHSSMSMKGATGKVGDRVSCPLCLKHELEGVNVYGLLACATVFDVPDNSGIVRWRIRRIGDACFVQCLITDTHYPTKGYTSLSEAYRWVTDRKNGEGDER